MYQLKTVAMRTSELTAKNILEQMSEKQIKKAVVTVYAPLSKNNRLELKKILCTITVDSTATPEMIANAIQINGGWRTQVWMGGEYQRILRNLGYANEKGVLVKPLDA